MKVLLVAPQPFFVVRGTPLNVLQMCRALTAAGHTVDLATYPFGDDVEIPGLRIHRAAGIPGIRSVPIGFSKRKVLLDILLAATVLRLALAGRYDVVHAVEEAVLFSLPIARLRRIPLIYDLDSVLSGQLADAGVIRSPRLVTAMRGLERAVLQRSACAITVCRSLTDFVHSVSPDTPVFQIEDAPLAEADRVPDPARVRRLRRDLELEGRAVFLYTGNFEPYQGIDVLLEAIPLVTSTHPEAVFVLVGGTDEQVATLRDRAVREGIGGHLRFTGTRPPEELPEYLALADGLLSPRTQGENTPLKIYSYMLAGKPIVATDLPTHTQVLDASTAVLVPPTAEAFAGGLKKVLADPSHASKLAATARAKVRRDYSSSAFRRRLAEAYEALQTATSMPVER